MRWCVSSPSVGQTIGEKMTPSRTLEKFDESKKDSCQAEKEFLAWHKKNGIKMASFDKFVLFAKET